MSLLLTTSPKHCAIKNKLLPINKKLLYSLSTTIISLLAFILLVYLILRPSKPQFHLRDAAVYDLSLSSSPRLLLNSTIDATVASTNPNSHVGVYYDQLRAYVAYKGQQITAEATLPPFYQGHGDTNLLSASLSGAGVPVAPSFGAEVQRDQTTSGEVVLRVRLDGELRWKVGSWVSGKYRFDVECAAIVRAGGGAAAGAALSLLEGAQCSTTV